MKYGFIKTATDTPHTDVAGCFANADRIIESARAAAKKGVSLLVLPELCITGYTCGDLFFQKELLTGAEEALAKIIDASVNFSNTVLAVGLPIKFKNSIYNCAVVVLNGRLLGVVPKANIPNYNEFYEKRYFSAAPEGNRSINLCGQDVLFGTDILFKCAQQDDFCFAVEICEDLWVASSPSIRHAAEGARIIANLSASNEIIGKNEYRRALVKSRSAVNVCGYIYANAGDGESTDDLVFSGHSIIAENGVVLAETEPFENKMACADIDVERISAERSKIGAQSGSAANYQTVYFDLQPDGADIERQIEKYPFVPQDKALLERRCGEITAMQAAALKKRWEHIRAKTVVLGISGGLDSSLALLVCVKTADLMKRSRKDIVAVTMPCFGTTERTKSNAERLCESLGVTLRKVDITAAVIRHFEDISHDKNKYDEVYENSQARERTQVLMDIANQTGGIVIGTGDLSELALGWATYNGDHMSMYGVNASLPKTLIRHVAEYEAKRYGTAAAEIMADILDTPISPELLPVETDGEMGQKTEDLVGPYELHDFFIYYMLRFGFSPKKIYYLARRAFCGQYDNGTILKWLRIFYRRFFANQFKRMCTPGAPKIGSVSVSPRGDLRMPSDAKADIWLAELDKLV